MGTSESESIKHNRPVLAVIWINFGHYHQVRIRALTPFFEVTAIQLAKQQLLYSWAFEHEPLDCCVETIAEQPWEDADQFLTAYRVWKLLNKIRPSTVLIPGYANLPSLSAALWCRLHGAKSILMTESTERDCDRNRFREFVKSQTIQILFDRAIAGGVRSLHYLNELRFNESRTGRYYDVVDNEYYMRSVSALPVTRPPNLPSPYFLYVGRLSTEKNLPRLIQAFADYCQRGGAWDLILVGEGPLRQQLETLCVNLGLKARIRIEGNKPTSELVTYYGYAKALVHPSLSEPWGLVVNEAMAAGLPVIVSSACGCAPDLVQEGVNGCLFDPENIEEITARLLETSQLRESRRRDMGRSSLEIINRFSPESWGREILRLALN